MLYVSDITLAIMSAAGRDTLFALLARLRSEDGTVAFDSNYRPRLWPDEDTAQREITRGAAAATMFLSSLDDEHLLFGNASPAASATRLHALGAPEVVIKNGAEQCLVSGTGDASAEQWHVSPPVVAQPLDTTAAGDSFNAAYIAARMQGIGPKEAAQSGAKLAAEVIQHRGAIIKLE